MERRSGFVDGEISVCFVKRSTKVYAAIMWMWDPKQVQQTVEWKPKERPNGEMLEVWDRAFKAQNRGTKCVWDT